MKIFTFFLFIFTYTAYSQTIKVESYEYQTTLDSIDNWIETNPSDYEGTFHFVQNGTDSYNFTYRNGKASLKEIFESLTWNDKTTINNVSLNQNIIHGYDERGGGREFNAKFIKLKCAFYYGYYGLLIDDEFVYLMQGD